MIGDLMAVHDLDLMPGVGAHRLVRGVTILCFMHCMATFTAEAAGMDKPREHENLQKQGQAQGTEAADRRTHDFGR